MPYQQIREKSHRLPPEEYIGRKNISFDICARDNKALFVYNETIEIFNDYLSEALNQYTCNVIVYLYMPDHLHIILSGKNKNSNIKKCIESFKQKTGFWLAQNKEEFRWQKDYYDHILRGKNDLINHIKYIINNPVKAGMVDDWKHYKFLGPSVEEIERMLLL